MGKSVLDSKLGEDHDITVLRVLDAGEEGWAPLRRVIQPEDVLLVHCSLPDLIRLRGTMGLRIDADFTLRDETLQTEDLRLVQVLVAPDSALIGRTLKDLDFRSRYRALVLAMQRRGETINDKLRSIKLDVGDSLLVQAQDAAIRDMRRSSDFIVLNEVPGSVLRRKAPLAIGILAVVVGLAAFDVLPILAAALLGCVALVMTPRSPPGGGLPRHQLAGHLPSGRSAPLGDRHAHQRSGGLHGRIRGRIGRSYGTP